MNDRLNSVRDIPRTSKRFKVPEDVLYSIYSQKMVRRTKRDFYLIQRQSLTMLREWRNGKSLLEIAEERMFSPILTASFILKNDGYTKKQFKDLLHNPDSIRDDRFRKEIIDILDADIIYSPQGIENQKNRGIFCEEQIKYWLDDREMEYCTEEESRALERSKTPDFLLKEPYIMDGKSIRWFESKGSFGSPYQTRYDYDNQLSHYLKLFGPGLVSYWLGYVDDISMGKEIIMVDRRFFQNGC
ncbi:MAG: TPD domain-containing protein [Candidatus Methanofastidiosa archaeon]|nr:TPD domain-containing protein [Candidatus Methanofastidiosa archaeon]